MRDTDITLFISIVFIVLLFFVILIFPFVRFSTLRAGEHTGFITAVEQEGLIFPNYRVYFKTDLSSSQEDIYCMNRKEADMASRLKDAATNKERLTIKYDGVRGIGLGLCSGWAIVGIK